LVGDLFSFSLCNLCVLCVSVVSVFAAIVHHRAALLVGQADNEMKLWCRAGES